MATQRLLKSCMGGLRSTAASTGGPAYRRAFASSSRSGSAQTTRDARVAACGAALTLAGMVSPASLRLNYAFILHEPG